ncbi:hypothetical protein [Neisseria sp. S1]|uniref:hypothetical protein n=1 Tax=Neisseria sp. S1 TaxID=3318354 RepID=UPI003A840A28
MKKAIITAIAAAAMLTACGDKNSASNTQFKKSIERYAGQNRFCLPLSLDIQSPENGSSSGIMLGEPVIKIAEQNRNGQEINENNLKQMRLLTNEGFYERQKTEITEDGDENIRTQVFQLTEKGNRQVRPSSHGPLFCLGVQTVDKINWYTEPTPSNGVTVSQVSYEAEFKPESWARKLIKQGGDSWADIEKTRTQSATLMQTNDGWRDVRELQ